MDKGEKRSFDQMEGSSSTYVYVLSQSEQRSLDEATYEQPIFSTAKRNSNLDFSHKMAAYKASPSVVSLVSFSGELLVSQCSGTILEVDGTTNTVLTSLNLIRKPRRENIVPLAEDAFALVENSKIIVRSSDDASYIGLIETYDFHYNLLVVKFKSIAPLSPATVTMIDDNLVPDTSFQLRPHGSIARPGDSVVAVGRYFYDSYELMAAPGHLSLERFKLQRYSCRELISASCYISRCGDGAPLVNLSGEVIGVLYYDIEPNAPLLPINVALKWWINFKTQRELRHPSYGFDGSHVFCADLPTIERVLKKFPGNSNGVLVERVQPGSNSASWGLREDDIIIRCDGRAVGSFFGLWDLMWDKVGKVVELEVLRAGDASCLSIAMRVGEAFPNEVNSWLRL